MSHSRVAVALLIGLGAGMLPAPGWLASTLEIVGALWVNSIRMPVLPLVVSLLIVAIAGSGDGRRVGRLGLESFAIFIALLAVFVAVVTVLTPILFRSFTIDPVASQALRASAGIDPAALRSGTLRDWFVSLIPNNPFKAAADGALLPLIVVGLLYGSALGRVAIDRRQEQIRFFQGIADAMLVIIRWVVVIGPIGVFALAFSLGRNLGLAAVGAIGYYLFVSLAAIVVALVALYAINIGLGRLSFRDLQGTLTPPQALAVGARSSLAALPLLIEGARDRLRLPEPIVSLVLPLAASVFKIAAMVTWPIGALVVARLYGLEFGAAQLALFAVGTVVLSLSSPGIPSGGFFVQAPLYIAVGLPPEGLGVLLAVDLPLDLIKGPLNVTGYLTTGVLVDRLQRRRSAER